LADELPQQGAVWATYGLAGSPFFHNPLQSLSGVNFGIHLFRGEKREEDARKIANRVLNSANSVRLIEGRAGIGKTTLANRAKSLLLDRNDCAVFPDLVQIDLHQDKPLESLAAELLYAAIRAVASHPRARELGIEAEVKAEGEGLVLDGLLTVPQNQLSLSYIVGFSRTRNQFRQEARHRPLAEWHEALRRVAATARSVGINAIVLHVNNIDQSTISDPEAVGDLFGHARDLLQTEGYHFLLCANEQFRTRALKDRSNVKDLLGAPLRPALLTEEEAAQIVQARYDDQRRFFGGDRAFVPPIAPDQAAHVFAVFGGELRSAFECIERAFVEELGPTGSPVQLSADQVLDLQRPVFLDMFRTLGPAHQQVLYALVRLTKDGRQEVRQNELVHFLGNEDDGDKFSQGYVSQLAEELVNERWVTKHQPNSRASFYNLGGRTRILLPDLRRTMSTAGMAESQTALSEFSERPGFDRSSQ
jgi:hypothetical protein